MTTRILKKLVLAIALCTIGTASAMAQVGITLYDNTDSAPGGNFLIAENSPLGGSFSTGTETVNLTSFSAVLGITAAATGSTTFSLYTNDTESPSPGNLIATIATIADATLTATFTEYTFADLSIALTASTRYWVVASATGNARWISASNDSGTGVVGEYIIIDFSQEYIFPSSDGPMKMSVVATAVPEPSSAAALIGIGAIAMALARRSFRKS